MTVISPAGKVLRRWGKPGSGPGEFRFIPPDPSDPTDAEGKIAVGPDGKVYVSDSGNGRVQVFTPQGRFVRQFGSFGSGKGQFLRPSDLAADNAGNVYVADDQARTLQVLPSREGHLADRRRFQRPGPESATIHFWRASTRTAGSSW